MKEAQPILLYPDDTNVNQPNGCLDKLKEWAGLCGQVTGTLMESGDLITRMAGLTGPNSNMLLTMNRRSKPSLTPLLLVLMLVVWPLQAQTVFACAMMDTVMHVACCCDDHHDCADSDCDDALESNRGPCCKQSVELSFDQDVQQNTPVIKPVELRSDVDPSQAMVATLDLTLPPQSVAAFVVFPRIDFPGQSGSDTYLITQRLRI